MSRYVGDVWSGRKAWSLVTVAGLVMGGASLMALADDERSHNDDDDDGDGGEPGGVPVLAAGMLRSCEGRPGLHGSVFLVERASDEGVKQVEVLVHARGLAPGRHAVHIHQAGSCDPCSAAGGHFDPGPAGDPDPDANHPYHAGDLVNIEVGTAGHGLLRTASTRFTLSDGPLTLFDDDGAALMIHETEDTYCPDGPEAGCAGQGYLACAVLGLSD